MTRAMGCALTLLLMGCAAAPAPALPLAVEDNDVETAPYPDAESASANAADACGAAGAILWALRCSEARVTVEGMRFPAFCRSRWPAIDDRCIAGAHSRRELRLKCHVACAPAP